MRRHRLAGMLAAVVLASVLVILNTPARSAQNTIVYVRNQPYQGTTLQQNGDIYLSLAGLLKALRFGWQVSGNTLTILPQGRPGVALKAPRYTYVYRGKTVSIPTIDQGSEPWVSLKGAAQALGAGYQYNSDLGIAEVYFVSAAPPEAAASPSASASASASTAVTTSSASPAAAASSSASPAAAASSSASPAAAASSSASPAAVASSTASPAADSSASPAPTPKPTPQPDVEITHKQVVPDYSQGILHVSFTVSNPADVPARDVSVTVTVKDGSGNQVGSAQYPYIGDMAPHATADRTVDVSHPDYTSMPRGLYSADVTVTFKR
ncbi:MAG: hypothetical protein ACYCW6_21605 [Candidatus Xenobia bacterium]